MWRSRWAFEFDLSDKTLFSTGLIWQKTASVFDTYGLPALGVSGNDLKLGRKSFLALIGTEVSMKNTMHLPKFHTNSAMI